MKPITMEELAKEEAIQRKPFQARCPMKDCSRIGVYERCYLDIFVNCPIYYIKYQSLNTEQRRLL